MIRERRGRCKAEALHRARAAAEAQHIKETFNEKGLGQSATKSQPPPIEKQSRLAIIATPRYRRRKKRGNEGSGAALMTCTCNVMEAETKHKQQAPT